MEELAHKAHWAVILAVLLLVGVVQFGLGVRGVVESFLYPRAVVLTCAEFSRLHPKAGRYRVTGCTLDLTSAGSVTWGRGSHPSSVYAPALPLGANPGAPASLVVETDQSNDLETVQHLHLMEANGRGSARISDWTVAHEREVWPTRDIEGMVRTGEMNRELRGTMAGRLAGYVVLREGDRPNLAAALVGMVLSAGLSVWLALSWPWYLRRRIGLALRRLRLRMTAAPSAAAASPPAAPFREEAELIVPFGRTVEEGLPVGSELVVPPGYLGLVVRKARIYDRLPEGSHAVSRKAFPFSRANSGGETGRSLPWTRCATWCARARWTARSKRSSPGRLGRLPSTRGCFGESPAWRSATRRGFWRESSTC